MIIPANGEALSVNPEDGGLRLLFQRRPIDPDEDIWRSSFVIRSQGVSHVHPL